MADRRQERAALERAGARLRTLDWYPRPVRTRRVRLVSAPLLFKLPWLRRFDGYATWNVIFLRAPLGETSDDLVTHELCHVWQMQHRPIRMPLSYLWQGYAANVYEIEARRATQLTARAPGRPAAPHRAVNPGQAPTGTRG